MSFDLKEKKHSLSSKLLVSVSGWLICAVLFTGLTLNLSWELEQGGVAINDAGSLRMRVYHMVSLLNQPNAAGAVQEEQRNFEKILGRLSESNPYSWLFSRSSSVPEQVNKTQSHWQTQIKPWVNELMQTGRPVSAAQLHQADLFVQELNVLVKLIEVQNTRHIELLRFFQVLLIVMILFTAFSAIYLLFKFVIRPLDRLKEGIDQVGRGQLHNRIDVLSKDEFGIVSAGFNQMTESLEDLYGNLEKKVKEKTQALEEKNHELSLLYEITAFLHETHTKENMAQGFLKYIMPLCQADAGSVRLLDADRRKFDYISHIGLSDEFLSAETCAALDGCYCGDSVKHSKAVVFDIHDLDKKELQCIKAQFQKFVVFHIRNHDHEIGIVTLYFHKNHSLNLQDLRLLEALSNQLGVSIENQRLVLRDKQFAVVEERNLMAQGLHDSIAQSLSFLNMQVQMLESAIKNGENEQAQENLTFIREGVQESYEDVRELLLNFRVRINKEEFPEAVHSLVKRFQQQTDVDVELAIQGNGPSLNPQQQLQVVFILQEALSNIRKHAQASKVTININNDAAFSMTIQDNGVGFDSDKIQSKKSSHVGLSIMKERATQIAAHIEVQSVKTKGTCVTLCIPEEKRVIL
ncbi:histidine kinase [Neisseria sp. Ec49-e6-T10]|uniref:histidine kinase n=1 Tax=Neisseria sp. Ec49-e6-T10 TaxID=3140744 RepID=UPI003EBE19C1